MDASRLAAGLMALALDADHILNAAGFQISGRSSHSISFAIVASIIIGFAATQIFRREALTIPAISQPSGKIGKKAIVNPTNQTNLDWIRRK